MTAPRDSLSKARRPVRRGVLRVVTSGARARASGAVVAVAFGLVALGACGGGGAEGGGEAKGPVTQRSQDLVHEPCENKGKVDGLDANADGKPDIQRIMDGSR